MIDLSYLELMSDGDDDMKLTMIEMLLEEIPVEIEKMKTLYENSDWKELREVSHKMKSTLSFVGNTAMTDANQCIEEISKTESGLSELPNLIALLVEMYPKVLKALKEAAAAI